MPSLPPISLPHVSTSSHPYRSTTRGYEASTQPQYDRTTARRPYESTTKGYEASSALPYGHTTTLPYGHTTKRYDTPTPPPYDRTTSSLNESTTTTAGSFACDENPQAEIDYNSQQDLHFEVAFRVK